MAAQPPDPFSIRAAPVPASTPWVPPAGPQEAQSTSTATLGPAMLLEMDPDYVHQRTLQGLVIMAQPVTDPIASRTRSRAQ